MSVTHKGTCFCGAVEFAAAGAPLEMGYCHCSSCRFHTGGPMVAFALYRADDVRVTKGAALLGRFNKSGMSDRQFCTKCGGQLMSVHPTLGLTSVYASALRDLDFKPSVHLNYAEAVLPVRDGLPKLRDFPAAVGGSGETLPE